MDNCPRWLDTFIKLVRPGVMAAMFGLLVFGGVLLALTEIALPGRGMEATKAFVGFLAAINDEFYETLRFMFGAYVIARSGQEVAREITEQKKITANTNANPTG